MNKITEFYSKAILDDTMKKKLNDILKGVDINSANDSQLKKIGEIANEMGYDISLEEAKAFINAEELSLSDEDLDAVAGGGKGDRYETDIHVCQIGGSAE